MKKTLFSLFALSALLLSGCNEEVQVNANYEPTPVIFGLLDQSENIHMIKINRGFVGPGDAFTFAQIPDSNYFDNVSGKVEELINNVAVRTWQLQDTLINTKSTDGVFFGPQQKVYFFNNGSTPLDENATYRLTVDINEGELEVIGETKLVAGFGTQNSLQVQTTSLKVAKDPGEYLAPTVWTSAGNAAFGSVAINIDIAEIRGTDTTFLKTPWKLGEGPVSSGKVSATGQGETFYSLIRAGLTNDNTITRRNFMGFTAEFIGGSTDFYNYILVNKPSSSLTQTKPTFTNLSVSNGYKVVGLFSARHTVRQYKPFVFGTLYYVRALDQNSTRELCQGNILATYLFCSQHPGDIGGVNPKDYACP